MKINNLIGLVGKIQSGKDLIGEMLIYIEQVKNPTYADYTTFLNFPYNEVKIKKYADKLKEVVAIIIGCTRKDLEDETFKNTPLPEQWDNFDVKLTPRKFLQILGTEVGREMIHPNLWVNSLFNDYKPFNKGKAHDNLTMHDLYGEHTCKYCSSKFYGYKRQYLCKECIDNDDVQMYPKWVISDVRFPNNEGEAIKSRGGLLIGVKRKFALRFPQYLDIANELNPYHIPYKLMAINPELYKSLTHESELAQGDQSWCDAIIENNGTFEELFNQVLIAVKVKYK